jgi:hypothetical protein
VTAPVYDLWPADFGALSVVPPVTILRMQAARLAERTQGLVEAYTVSGQRNADFYYLFYLRAPALDNYSYLLLSVLHPIGLYPATLVAETTGETYTAATEEDFKEKLRSVLSSPEARRVVQSLLAQSQELAPARGP